MHNSQVERGCRMLRIDLERSLQQRFHFCTASLAVCGISQLPESECIVIVRVSAIRLKSHVAVESFHEIGVGLILSLLNFAQKLVREGIVRIQIRRAADSLTASS